MIDEMLITPDCAGMDLHTNPNDLSEIFASQLVILQNFRRKCVCVRDPPPVCLMVLVD